MTPNVAPLHDAILAKRLELIQPRSLGSLSRMPHPSLMLTTEVLMLTSRKRQKWLLPARATVAACIKKLHVSWGCLH